MKNEDLVGHWRLVSSEFRLEDGQVVYPMGEDATGMLIYTAGGYMCVQVMRPDRCAFDSIDIQEGNIEDMKSVLEGYIAYFGTYDVNEEKGAVIHKIEGSLFPNWVGLYQRRFLEFSGDELTLSAPRVLLGGQLMTGLLRWKRIE